MDKFFLTRMKDFDSMEDGFVKFKVNPNSYLQMIIIEVGVIFIVEGSYIVITASEREHTNVFDWDENTFLLDMIGVKLGDYAGGLVHSRYEYRLDHYKIQHEGNVYVGFKHFNLAANAKVLFHLVGFVQ